MEQNIQELWYNIKDVTNRSVIGIAGEEREKAVKDLFEGIMTDSFGK